MKNPTYLVRRESGIWQFQIRVPSHISPIPKVVRKSTRTTDYRTALKIARQWQITLDGQWSRETTSNMTAPVFKLPETGNTDTRTLAELAKQCISEKQGTIAKATLKEFRQAVDLFVEILGLYGITEPQGVTRQALKEYKSKLKGLPSNMRKRFPDSSLVDIIKMDADRKLAPATFDKNLRNVRQFLYWLGDEEIIGEPTGLVRALIKGNASVRPVKARIPYTAAQAGKLLEGHLKYPQMSIPTRIAAYTGMRMREVLGLHKEDVRQDNGIWVFDIKRNLKTASSKGMVPIAQELIDMMFLRFVQALPDGPLFSEVLSTVGYGPFSKAYQRFQVKMIGPKPEDNMLDFHSWRHTVRTRLSEAGVPLHIADMVTRHSNSRVSVGEAVYNHHNYLREMKDAVDKVTYPVDAVALDEIDNFHGLRR